MKGGINRYVFSDQNQLIEAFVTKHTHNDNRQTLIPEVATLPVQVEHRSINGSIKRSKENYRHLCYISPFITFCCDCKCMKERERETELWDSFTSCVQTDIPCDLFH